MTKAQPVGIEVCALWIVSVIILGAVPEPVADAYERLQERASVWWYA